MNFAISSDVSSRIQVGEEGTEVQRAEHELWNAVEERVRRSCQLLEIFSTYSAA